MKKLPLGLLALLFLPMFFFVSIAPVLIVSSFYLLGKKDSPMAVLASGQTNPRPVYNLFATPPPVLGSFTSLITVTDARSLVLEQFFAKYHSPLAPYGQLFVDVSEKFNIPWQLLPAISMQESTGGKNLPEDCFNPFGWGIHARGTLCFKDWEEAIENVAKGIKEKYIDQGLITLDQIMSKYNPISYNRDGSWANGVNFFLNEIGFFNTP